MDKPWVDVGTMVVARLAVGRCIPSFVEHVSDRDQFRLRWICHLDQYGLPGLEHLWEQQLQEIVTVAKLFDDCTIIANRSHVGYGGAFLRILREVRHPLLYTDDDQLFTRNISISEPINSGLDYFNWHNSPAGSTVPSYWSPRVVAFALTNFPSEPHKVTERALLILVGGGNFRTNYDRTYTGGRINWPSNNAGRLFTKRLHVPKFGPHRRYIGDDGTPHVVGKGEALDRANE